MSDLGDHIEAVARCYWGVPNAKLSNGTELRFGTHGSKSVDLQKGVWYDHENDVGGGVVELIRLGERRPENAPVQDILSSKFGISRQPLPLGAASSAVVKNYDYRDAKGEVVYQVTRSADKKFRQRRPDGAGGYIYNLKDVDPVPYNLPMIMQASDEPIFVVEGEKCADALMAAGLIATTNSGGAGKWPDALSEYFQDRDVIVLPDNDAPGMKHADQVAASLWLKAKRIKCVALPGLPPKGDVVNFLATNTVEDLLQHVRTASELSVRPAVELASESPAEPHIEPFEVLGREAVWSMPPVEFLVDQLLPEKSFCMMYGSPGAGKSFMAIDLALSVAHGRPWHGFDTKQGAVLYIAAEGIGGFGKRWKAWEKHKAIEKDVPLLVLPKAVNFMDEEQLSKLMATIEHLDEPIVMVVVDTVHRVMHGSDENSASEMAHFIDACDAIQRHTGDTMLAVHHAGKNTSQGARGSNSLLAAVHTSLMVSKSEDLVTLRVEKQKDAEPLSEGLNFIMLRVPAGISETSVVLQRTDETPKQKYRQQYRWRNDPEAYHAFQALQNLLIDQGVTRVHASAWHEAHKAKEPDLDRRRREKARQKLLNAEIVVCDKNIVWINRELA